MANDMFNLKKITRQQWIGIGVILVCIVFGIALGMYRLSANLRESQRNNEEKAVQADVGFVLPIAPPEAKTPSLIEKSANDTKEVDTTAVKVDLIDQSELRVWEVAARQTLPPRKEPLTARRWRVVGVTAVGDVKNVLLLFENQPATVVLKTGDKLPGGAKITQIAQDHLQISLNGQLMKLNLRKQ